MLAKRSVFFLLCSCTVQLLTLLAVFLTLQTWHRTANLRRERFEIVTPKHIVQATLITLPLEICRMIFALENKLLPLKIKNMWLWKRPHFCVFENLPNGILLLQLFHSVCCLPPSQTSRQTFPCCFIKTV